MARPAARGAARAGRSGRNRVAALPRAERRAVCRRSPEHRGAEAGRSQQRGDQGQDRPPAEGIDVPAADVDDRARRGGARHVPGDSGEPVHPAAENRAREPAAAARAAGREAGRAASRDAADPVGDSSVTDEAGRRDREGRAGREDRIPGGAGAGTEPDVGAERPEGRSAVDEPQGDRLRRSGTRCRELQADLPEPAAAREGNRRIGRAQDEQHPHRRPGRRLVRPGEPAPDAQPADRASGRHPLRRRRRVLLRVHGQPDQDAGRAANAAGSAVDGHHSEVDRRARRRPAHQWQRAGELRRSVPGASHERAVLVRRRGIALGGRDEHGTGRRQDHGGVQSGAGHGDGRPARAAHRRRHAPPARARGAQNSARTRALEPAGRARRRRTR